MAGMFLDAGWHPIIKQPKANLRSTLGECPLHRKRNGARRNGARRNADMRLGAIW
jgi:hypothetical protein